jgi:predicted RNA-binding protein YlqC (UPF0109 family)
MSSIDEQFVDFIVKSLVGNPDAVVIERRVDEKGVLLELTVDPEDLGRIIGKRGATAQSLRTLLRALGTKNDARYNLKIVDNGPEDYARPPRPENTQEQPATSSQQPTASSDEPDRTAVDDDTENVEEIVSEVAEELADEKQTEDSSDLARKTRAELEDLDDLDI